jgi:hypothetical protein
MMVDYFLRVLYLYYVTVKEAETEKLGSLKAEEHKYFWANPTDKRAMSEPWVAH